MSRRKERPMRAHGPLLPAIVLCLYLGSLALSDGRAQAPKADGPRSYQGLSAVLALGEKEARAGEPMEVTITLTSNADTHRLFNPFFNGLLEQPGRLVIRDRDGKVVNRLLDFREGSRRTPHESDHIRLPGGGFV